MFARASQAISRTPALDRYARGRARAVASILGADAAAVEAEVLAELGAGVPPDVALDRLVLESIR